MEKNGNYDQSCVSFSADPSHVTKESNGSPAPNSKPVSPSDLIRFSEAHFRRFEDQSNEERKSLEAPNSGSLLCQAIFFSDDELKKAIDLNITLNEERLKHLEEELLQKEHAWKTELQFLKRQTETGAEVLCATRREFYESRRNIQQQKESEKQEMEKTAEEIQKIILDTESFNDSLVELEKRYELMKSTLEAYQLKERVARQQLEAVNANLNDNEKMWADLLSKTQQHSSGSSSEIGKAEGKAVIGKKTLLQAQKKILEMKETSLETSLIHKQDELEELNRFYKALTKKFESEL